jgi:inosine-uridine nucleoside N-ribohydrolase
MVGVFGVTDSQGLPTVKWNAGLDSHATAMVYKDIKVHKRSVRLDVTTQVVMNRQEVEERFASEILLPVRDF